MGKKEARVFFPCSQQREQQTQFGKLIWRCPGTKMPIISVFVKYRCINQKCSFTTIVDNRIGLNGWKHPVCTLSSCKNKIGKPTPMVTEDAYNQNLSRLTSVAPKAERKGQYFPKGTKLECIKCKTGETVDNVTEKYRWRCSNCKELKMSPIHFPVGAAFQCGKCSSKAFIKTAGPPPACRNKCGGIMQSVKGDSRRRLIERFI